MKRSEVNKDPARAYARALADLRCAARKLIAEAEEAGDNECADTLSLCLGDIVRVVVLARSRRLGEK